MGDDVEKASPVTFRQARWWTPLRVALCLTALIWIALAALGILGAIEGATDPDGADYGGAAGGFAWVLFLFGGLYAVPLTVLVWVVGLPFIIIRAVRRARRSTESPT